MAPRPEPLHREHRVGTIVVLAVFTVLLGLYGIAMLACAAIAPLEVSVVCNAIAALAGVWLAIVWVGMLSRSDAPNARIHALPRSGLSAGLRGRRL